MTPEVACAGTKGSANVACQEKWLEADFEIQKTKITQKYRAKYQDLAKGLAMQYGPMEAAPMAMELKKKQKELYGEYISDSQPPPEPPSPTATVVAPMPAAH